jgi:hypothetical protein
MHLSRRPETTPGAPWKASEAAPLGWMAHNSLVFGLARSVVLPVERSRVSRIRQDSASGKGCSVAAGRTAIGLAGGLETRRVGGAFRSRHPAVSD